MLQIAVQRTLLALVAIAALLSLAACGSSGDSSPSASEPSEVSDRDSSDRDPCVPARTEEPAADPPKRSAEGRTNSVEVGDSQVELVVLSSASPVKIPVSFEDREAFHPPKGYELVAVTYEATNLGESAFKPSKDLNSRFLIRVSGATYPYAAKAPCSVPITASWAVQHGGQNPAIPISTSESVKTAVVFIIPKQPKGTPISLVLPEQLGIALRP